MGQHVYAVHIHVQDQIEVVWSIKGVHNIAVECRTKADMSPMATGQFLQLVLHRLEEEL